MSAPAQSIPHHQDPAPVQLTIPPKLYGRERELAALTGAFAEVGAGHGLVLLVPGHSGSGKTALVQALREPVRKKNGFFLEGKFNQYQQGVPLFAIRQALGQLAKELLAASAPERLQWKTRILEAAGNLGRLLTELVPELEPMLGPQPAVPDISPYEAPHRFATVLRNFLAVFCRAEHPVVLFVDDWQWAGPASLAVFRQLQVNTSLRYLLVVASYRDNEVDANHPFTAAVEELRLQSVPTRILEVRDLGSAEVQELLTDTLPPATEDLAGLTRFIQDSTRGNPFFMRTFLEFLHARQALWFDQPRQAWRWKAATLEDQGGPGGVVALFGHKLRQLPVACRELLSLAACIGNRFDLETLALVSERSPAECLALLRAALDQRLVLPLAGGPQGALPPPGGPSQGFLFQHDRVQQAAYSLLAPDEMPGLRLRIGRLLLAHLTPGQLDERLLEVTDHLNAGRSLVVEEAEQVKLVALNVAAGRKARSSTAYHAALQFHRAAGGFVAQPGFTGRLWHLHPDLVLQFFKDWAESEFLEGDRMEAERCIQEAVAHARTPLEQADALCILIVQCTLLARYPEAIAAGRRALAALGIALPETDFETARDAEIERVRQHLGSRSVAALRDAPVMTDPTMLMATRLLITMGPPCYRSHQRLWSVIVPRVVDLTLQYGPVPQVGYSHPAFGGLLGWVANDYATAREFAELATRLMTEVFSTPSAQSVFYLMIGSSSRHWFQHLAAASQDYLQAWETGLHSGNLQYAAYAFGHNMYCRFYQGIPLDVLIQESRESLAFSRTRTNQWAIDLMEGGLQVFGGLAAAEGGEDSAQSWSEAEYLQQVEAHHNIQVACIYRVLKASSLLLLGDYERALAVSDEAEPLLYTVGTQGLLPWPEHVFTRLLLLAILHSEAEASRQTAWRGEIKRMVAQLQIWATHCPDNYRHKYAFARAEVARLDGQPAEALRCYEEAIEAARAGRFTQWEGMANERAARLAQAGGQERLAHLHWQNAYFCHHRWGAVAKLRRMEQEFLAELAAGPLYAAPPTPVGDASPGRAGLAARLEPHLQALRAQAAWVDRERAQLDHPEPVEELTQATQHLREEVAERKRVEAELEHHREQLQREIQERTTALETSQKLARQFEAQTHELEEQRSLLAATQAATLNLMEDFVAARDRAEQANIALRASEASLVHAQQIARVGNWDWNIVTDELDWSAQVFALFGISENDANRTYERFLHGVHPEDRERTHQAVQDALAGRAPYDIDHRVLWPDGTVLVMHEKGEVTRDAEGRALHMTGTVQDITERKQAEAALRESETRFRATFEQAAVGVAQVGLDGRWLRVNERLCHLVGYPAAELLRLTFQDITHPDDLTADLNHVRELLAGEIPNYALEKRYVRKDGSEIWTNLTASLVRDAADQPRYFISVIEDITARKQAEAKITEQLDELRRWHDVMLGREGRVLEVKQEVNELLARLGQPPRYPSAVEAPAAAAAGILPAVTGGFQPPGQPPTGATNPP